MNEIFLFYLKVMKKKTVDNSSKFYFKDCSVVSKPPVQQRTWLYKKHLMLMGKNALISK